LKGSSECWKRETANARAMKEANEKKEIMQKETVSRRGRMRLRIGEMEEPKNERIRKVRIRKIRKELRETKIIEQM
jgi:hypothetical protein